MDSNRTRETALSLDFPNRSDWPKTRNTPANLYRTRGRLLYGGGTYVRTRGTDEDKRLAYQRQCNENAGRRMPGRRAAI